MLDFTFAMLLLMAFIMVVRLRSMEKHDKVLFSFCETRRELVRYMMDKCDHEFRVDLPESDMVACMDMLNELDSTIHYYSAYKNNVFNLRRLAIHVKQSVVKIESVMVSENADIKRIQSIMARNQISAFLEYTLFLKHQLILSLAISILFASVKIGILKVHCGYLEYLLWLQKEKKSSVSQGVMA